MEIAVDPVACREEIADDDLVACQVESFDSVASQSEEFASYHC